MKMLQRGLLGLFLLAALLVALPIDCRKERGFRLLSLPTACWWLSGPELRRAI